MPLYPIHTKPEILRVFTKNPDKLKGEFVVIVSKAQNKI